MNAPQPPSAFETLDRISRRSTAALLGWSGLRSQPLRSHLLRVMEGVGGPDALLSEPVLEAAHGWELAEQTFGHLEGTLLSPELVAALDGSALPDPDGRERYRLPRGRSPYRHQIEAWRLLLKEDPRSVLVSSGTGSGKTECFLVPLLEQLTREAKRRVGPLRGVRAIMLYPLNALINSQRERLSDWTRPLGGQVRFCLYNGATPNNENKSEQASTPEEVRSRYLLRREPPPVLVTNITMLEYMLIRKEDRPIIEGSRGQLKYIVLDEAHSYVGSQAAELSLLLRRVMRAFGVRPEEVRVVATSATIGTPGDPRMREALAMFLADVAGVERGRVEVIEGRRRAPELPPVNPATRLPELDSLETGDPEALFDRLARAPAFRAGFEALRAKPLTFTQWREKVGANDQGAALLLAAAAKARRGGEPLQPLKIHAFHRTQSGLWVCPDRYCAARDGTALDDEAWPFGPVFPERIDRCPECSGQVLELAFCSQCGESALEAARACDANGMERLQARAAAATEDEFLAELTDEDDSDEPLAEGEVMAPADEVLIVAPGVGASRPTEIDPRTGEILDEHRPGAITLGVVAGRDQCPHCRVPFGGAGARLLPFRVGAPFLLGSIVPELVDDAQPNPANGRDASSLPAGGRQILTFTDSRQGTARLAAKLQGDAERNYIRALLYHAVQNRPVHTPDQQAKLDQCRQELRDLEAALVGNASPPSYLVSARATLLREIEALEPSQASVSWAQALQILQKDEVCRRWIRDEIWRERENVFAKDEVFAAFLFLREVIRRPLRANSIETLGLARLTFPYVEKTVALVPEAFSRHGGTLADWRDFLTLAVTRIFRGNFAVAVDRTVLHWIAPDIPTRFVVGPGRATGGDKNARAWPQAPAQAEPRSIVIKLLAAGLRLDGANALHRDDLATCMDKAWDAIRPLLRTDAVQGAQLDPESFALAPVEQAYLCPVTRRVVDRTFRGLSPNPRAAGEVFARAEPLDMPAFPFAFGRTGDGRDASRDAVEAWLRDDPKIAELRERGLWTDLHDRIAHLDTFYRSVEHSAQQPGHKLQRYEADFRKGAINVLNCSTTMEMGVDIGSIGTVLMTNVPPSAASYRQRVGRAGRRGQPLALSLTLCRQRPTELSAFRQPLSLLTRQLAAPSVSLDSAVIAQRHVNALLLSRFLGRVGAELRTLEAGFFYGFPAEGDPAVPGESSAERFLTWTEASATRGDAALDEDLTFLLRGTRFEGRHAAALDGTRDRLTELRRAFEREWTALRADMETVKEREAAYKALKITMRRLTGEYLLTELATRGFLPGHGFPTDVVPFDTSNAWIKERPKDGNEDASGRARYRDVPTRQLDLAIRDYAPGSEVVLDGLVYRSAGIRLDWKRPASEASVPEIQSLRFAWRCERCGSTDTHRSPPETCPSCGATGLKINRYLRPAGFTCDPITKPHSEIERVAYVPPRLPWIAARSGAWTSFADPAAGRYRASRDGMVFHYTSGATEHGYAVCLCCGRAEPEESRPTDNLPLPAELKRHKPLRTRRKDSDVCEAFGRSFAVQRHLHLGHEATTDVLEVQLSGLPGPAVGFPIAAGLREALARRLGIEPGEMSFGVTHTREAAGAELRWSVFLYDRAVGGAGFSISAAPHLPDLIAEACGILDCPKGDACRAACPECILSRDLEGQVVDRPAAFAFLRDVVRPRLVIPAANQLFGPRETRAEARPLADAIAEAVERPGAGLTLWIGGDPDNWDIGRWSALPLLRRLLLRGTCVELVVPDGAIAHVDDDVRLTLFGLAASGASLRTASSPPAIGSGISLARVEGEGGPTTVWASPFTEAALPDAGWGASGSAPVVRGHIHIGLDLGAPIDKASILRSQPGTALVEIRSELDGSIAAFGASFWQLLAERAPLLRTQCGDIGDELVALHYSDRYLASPLSVRLALELLRAAPGLSSRTTLKLDTAIGSPYPHGTAPHLIHHDWSVDAHAHAVVEAAMRYVGSKAQVRRLDRRDLPHGRVMTLRFARGTIRVVLDQGVGYWRACRRTPFDFTQNPDRQTAELRRASFQVAAGHPSPTWVVVTQALS